MTPENRDKKCKKGGKKSVSDIKPALLVHWNKRNEYREAKQFVGRDFKGREKTNGVNGIEKNLAQYESQIIG